MSEIGRAALAARVFTIAALSSLAALSGAEFVLGAVLVVFVAATAAALSAWTRLSETWVSLLEGCVVAALVVATFPDQVTVTPYLVTPALIAALDSGRRGMFRVVTAEFGLLILLWFTVIQQWDRDVLSSGFTWLATSIGIGIMGASLRTAVTNSETDASYRSAVALIRRLQALSGKLSGGLDPVDIAEQVMDTADKVVPTRQAGVFVPSTTGAAVPLRYSVGTSGAAMSWAGPLSDTCLAQGAPVLNGRQAALPLCVDDETVAVLILDGVQSVDERAAATIGDRLGPQALQLQAALLFGRVRDSATSQERQRIAREVHDGVAQDIASLGYLVDNLGTGTADPDQRERVDQLRRELTRVVTELRHSIFDMRHVIPAGAGLGESISAYARQVGSTSPMTVHVTLDEKGQRLRADVEHELLRIAQEAMSNARKHSGADNLWLRCTVRSPYAEIEVSDDGTRAHAPASDSHGLKIMRERAEIIGAVLDVEPPESGGSGTRVRVRVGGESG